MARKERRTREEPRRLKTMNSPTNKVHQRRHQARTLHPWKRLHGHVIGDCATARGVLSHAIILATLSLGGGSCMCVQSPRSPLGEWRTASGEVRLDHDASGSLLVWWPEGDASGVSTRPYAYILCRAPTVGETVFPRHADSMDSISLELRSEELLVMRVYLVGRANVDFEMQPER